MLTPVTKFPKSYLLQVATDLWWNSICNLLC